ncbi:MAG: CopG family transcriptional regulator [Elusimicrobia bacterium RIFOXYD12_FULL_66_9]|nr:MAG: CopG family transcriptional regulator [Elusimicrobia bacterium RIFOXYD12_FULL_66_9]
MTAEEFDRLTDEGKDITPYLDFEKMVVVRPKIQRVNVDFPEWMVKKLDEEAHKLNVSRQAIIKMWLRERLDPQRRITR